MQPGLDYMVGNAFKSREEMENDVENNLTRALVGDPWSVVPAWDLHWAMELSSAVAKREIKKVKLESGRWLEITPLEQAIAVDFYNACEKLYLAQLIK